MSYKQIQNERIKSGLSDGLQGIWIFSLILTQNFQIFLDNM